MNGKGSSKDYGKDSSEERQSRKAVKRLTYFADKQKSHGFYHGSLLLNLGLLIRVSMFQDLNDPAGLVVQLEQCAFNVDRYQPSLPSGTTTRPRA